MAISTRTFRPVLNAGVVYARLAGSAAPMESIGGIEVLELAIAEDTKKQTDYTRGGGGTRAQVKRVTGVTMSASLQDVNAANLARAVFGTATSVTGGTVSNETHTAYRGGIIPLANIVPTSVTVKIAADTVTMAGNYEVRPEGIYVLPDATGITDGDALIIGYTHTGHDLIEALTTTAPILEMYYAGVNEADSGSASTVEIFRVQLGAAKKVGLIDKDFGLLEIEGEVLSDPTKTGIGVSPFFRVRIQ